MIPWKHSKIAWSNCKITPMPKMPPPINSMYAMYNEVHWLKHLSQDLTVGQAELRAYKQVNPLFFSSLSPFWGFWFTSLSSKAQRKPYETATIATDSLANRGVVLSLFSLQNFPFSSPPTGGAETSHLCHSAQESCSKTSALTCFSPQKWIQILTLFPWTFLPTHFYHLCVVLPLACSLPLSECKYITWDQLSRSFLLSF